MSTTTTTTATATATDAAYSKNLPTLLAARESVVKAASAIDRATVRLSVKLLEYGIRAASVHFEDRAAFNAEFNETIERLAGHVSKSSAGTYRTNLWRVVKDHNGDALSAWGWVIANNVKSCAAIGTAYNTIKADADKADKPTEVAEVKPTEVAEVKPTEVAEVAEVAEVKDERVPVKFESLSEGVDTARTVGGLIDLMAALESAIVEGRAVPLTDKQAEMMSTALACLTSASVNA